MFVFIAKTRVSKWLDEEQQISEQVHEVGKSLVFAHMETHTQNSSAFKRHPQVVMTNHVRHMNTSSTMSESTLQNIIGLLSCCR